MNIAPIQKDWGFLCEGFKVGFFYVAEVQGVKNV